ncbi:phage tail tape measure protein [Glaciihabitans sp. dw_435]|uniref:phage tail tape measure protein n=1 Tax=Glaciihabitans sp. dw_435 TaxID=2720081 RepID=UPI001BD376E3|nr:phage tail tape measure protein [Glaciihabitans sp. dw_435]
MSGAQNAGSIAFSIQMIGQQVFAQEAKQAETAFKGVAAAAETTKAKVAPVGAELDKTGKAAKSTKAPLDDSAKSTKGLGDENAKAAPKVKQTAAELKELQEKAKAANTVVGTAAVGVGAAIATMAAVAVAKYTEFSDATTKTTAATMASAGEQKKLEQAALSAGASSVFSATEAANAQTELSKAGQSVNDILNGSLTGSLALAAAGELGVARAAEIAATTLTVFGLKGEAAGHVADLLSAGAGKAQGSVDDLALALDYVGVGSAQAHIGLDQTVGTLALLASNGIIGEKAGTQLRAMLASLQGPTTQASATMKQYNIDVYDGQKKFIGYAATAEMLKNKLGGLSDQEKAAALNRIFGVESMNAVNVLMTAGAAGVDEWTANVNDSGYAADQARQKTNNLSGDIEKLGGSMDSALIQTGSSANQELRTMTQTITNLVDWYSSLDASMQSSAFTIGVGAAAVLLLGGTFMLAVPKIVEFRAALTTLSTTMKGTALAGGGLGLALTAAVTVLGIFATNAANARARAESLAETLDKQTGAITRNSRAWAADELQKSGVIAAGKELGLTSSQVVGAYLQEADALKAYNRVVKDANDPNSEFSKSIRGTSKDMFFMRGEIDKVSKAIGDGDKALKDGRERNDDLASATEGSADATEQAAAAQTLLTQTTEAADAATKQWLETLTKSDAAFVDLQGAYDEVIQKNRDVATATADATKSSGDSWKDYYDGVSVGLDDYLATLQKQVDAQNNWENNLVALAGRASSGLLEELEKLGPQGAPLVADLVNSSADELSKAEALFGEKADDATGAFAQRLQDSQAVIAAAGAQLGSKTAEAVARELANGTSTIGDIVAKYGLTITSLVPQVQISTTQAQSNLNAFFTANNGRTLYLKTHVGTGPGGSGGIAFADGGRVNAYANGGREDHTAQFARAGTTARIWVEPETKGEYYIPVAEEKRGRSTTILAQAANEFGYDLVPRGAQRFADGGRSGSDTSPVTAGTSQPQFSLGGITFINPTAKDPAVDLQTAAEVMLMGLNG